MAKLPLEGIRVADITVVWAGTYGTMFLGDLGAEVIRVESIKRFPVFTRGLIPRPTKEMMSTWGYLASGFPDLDPGERPWNRFAMFNCHARNKLSMTVDLTKPKGIEIFKRLVALSDVVIENNAAGVMDKLGIGYEALKKVKPEIIMVSASGFGSSGPYKSYRGLGQHFEALAGHSLLRGYPDSDASSTTLVFMSDAVAGILIALATITALHYRNRTGKGQFIDLCQVESVASLLPQAHMDYAMNRRVQGTLGNRDPYMAPQGAYPCLGTDRWIAVSIYTEDQWEALCKVMGSPDLSKDQRFSSRERRLQNHDELDKIIEEWTSKRDPSELFHMLQKAGIPAGPIMSEADAFADPQLKRRGFFEKVTQADCGTHLYPGVLWKMSETPGAIRLPPCRLGEHNEYVYKEILGISEEEYAQLENEGHIGEDYAPEV